MGCHRSLSRRVRPRCKSDPPHTHYPTPQQNMRRPHQHMGNSLCTVRRRRRLLALNAILLFRARYAIMSKKPTALSSAIAFLHREFEPHLFWWELVEMLRRFVLVGLMVLVQDTMMQLILGTLLATAFLLFQVQASPYKQMSDDLLASAVSFGLVVIFLISSVFKYATLLELDDVKKKMSVEQKNLYILNQGTLTAIIFLAVIGSLVVSVIIFLVQLTAERRRVAHEKLHQKARRLRHRSDDEEISAPPIDSSGYHLFLSHVWGTGQECGDAQI